MNRLRAQVSDPACLIPALPSCLLPCLLFPALPPDSRLLRFLSLQVPSPIHPDDLPRHPVLVEQPHDGVAD